MMFRSNLGRMAVIAAGAALAAAVAATGTAAAPPAVAQPDPLSRVMQEKLDHAQGVLRALALEDYDALARHATALGELTKRAAWGALKTPEYRRHSADFLRETDNLAAAARAGDLNGATLDYAAMTVRCVQCHRHVKSQRAAD